MILTRQLNTLQLNNVGHCTALTWINDEIVGSPETAGCTFPDGWGEDIRTIRNKRPTVSSIGTIMTSAGEQVSLAVIRSVDAAIASSRAAMLTAAQLAQVSSLREQLQRAMDQGDKIELKRLAALILSIIREGPPSFF